MVRLSLPLAALAKRWAEKTLRAEDINAFFDVKAKAARYGAADGDLGRLRLSLASRRLPRSPARFQRTADREPGRHFRRAHRRREHDGGWAVSGRYRRRRSRANGPSTARSCSALLAGEFTVKRYRKKGARTWLQAENPALGNIEINEGFGLRSVGRDREVDPHAVPMGAPIDAVRGGSRPPIGRCGRCGPAGTRPAPGGSRDARRTG